MANGMRVILACMFMLHGLTVCTEDVQGEGGSVATSQTAAGRELFLESPSFSGRLLDNLANAGHEGSGFNPLCIDLYPGKPVFRPDFVGLNFEHIFNGAAADKGICMFTPRKDACELVPISSSSASIKWPVEHSSWGLGCTMTYQLAGPNAIDILFEATPTADRFPLGYAAFMWASYMNRTRERSIHFIGRNGTEEGWIGFGEDLSEGFETGTVSCAGVPDLPYEKKTATLNILEHGTKKFSQPFYYGLIDGDNDLATGGDTLAYIVMFDQTETIRFALWNFIRDSNHQPDPHSPAWDWQFVIHHPEVGKTYSYRARVVIKPFAGGEDVQREYKAWRASLDTGSPTR